MNSTENTFKDKIIFTAQLASISLIWIFVIGIAIWILNLISISVDLNDAPGISIAISLVAIPVFFTLASILTYVFVGFHRNSKSNLNKTLGD